jgi:Protein kinase domain
MNSDIENDDDDGAGTDADDDHDDDNVDDDKSTDEDERVVKRPRLERSPSPQVPPAPPSTPASLMEAHGPIPLIPYIQNADVLERDQLMRGELATPAPTRPAAVPESSKPKLDDFHHWVVGPRYQLVRMLGRGSYGQVAQAKDTWDDNKFVAIKRIAGAFDQEVDAVRLYREIHILRRLRGHDCIIRLLNVIEPTALEDFKDLYLVFECELGEKLDTFRRCWI